MTRGAAGRAAAREGRARSRDGAPALLATVPGRAAVAAGTERSGVAAAAAAAAARMPSFYSLPCSLMRTASGSPPEAVARGGTAAGTGGWGGGGRRRRGRGAAAAAAVVVDPGVRSLATATALARPPSPSPCSSPDDVVRGRRRRRRRSRYTGACAAAATAAATASAVFTAVAAAAVPGATASAAPTAAAATTAGSGGAGVEAATAPGRSKTGLVPRATAAAAAAAAATAAEPVPSWLRLSGAGPTGAMANTSSPLEAAGGDGLRRFLRSLWRRASKRELLEGVLKVVVWSFFAERLLQSALVGWGLSGRVGPVEQLGGTLMEANPSDARFEETRAVLKGVRVGRDTLHLNTAQASPEMFTKVDCTEIVHPPVRENAAAGDAYDDEGEYQEAGEDTGERGHAPPLLFFEYAAPAFAHLRGVYGMPSSEYRRSFREDSRMIALASNSKSAQSFMFSEDGKYMLKTASESELDSMLRLLPHYAEHVARRRGSLITRFFGVYRVTNPRTKRSTIFVSSSNVFSTEKRLHERYDLKGSVVGRRTIPRNSSAFKPTTMLKDLDLADRDKIRLAAGCKKRLMRELSADAEFLAGLGVMDYSLLVGIHRPLRPKSSRLLALPLSVLSVASKPVWAAGCFALGFLPGGARRGGRRPQVGVYPGREPGVVYYVGIIDVLQRYNLKKMLERGAKGVVYDRHELSAVPPDEYRDRFIAFIDGRTE